MQEPSLNTLLSPQPSRAAWGGGHPTHPPAPRSPSGTPLTLRHPTHPPAPRSPYGTPLTLRHPAHPTAPRSPSGAPLTLRHLTHPPARPSLSTRGKRLGASMALSAA